jgi:inosine-uridine nucleoside N-ribohydrolase
MFAWCSQVFHFEHPPLHDPCAVAFVIAPALFDTIPLRVDVETKSELSAGQTVCDIWRQSGKPSNVSVATRMDVGAFWDLMLDAMSKADAKAGPLLEQFSTKN